MNRFVQLTVIMVLLVSMAASIVHAADRRQYQHGVELLEHPDGGYWLLWSSSPGNPPSGGKKVVVKSGEKCEYFTHDIYYARIDPVAPIVNGDSLIALPEAQEPVSAAISDDGNILITYEDGSENDVTENCSASIQQRYRLYNSRLEPKTAIHTVATRGGHSGHAAAGGDRFIIAYAEGWVYGGGVDGAGTANDIHVDVIDSHGVDIHHQAITMDSGDPRDWWPMVAASKRYALLVWQRWVANRRYADLMYSVYDLQRNELIREVALLKSNVLYYHYNVQYLAAVNRFLVTGANLGNMRVRLSGKNIAVTTPKAFTYLLSETGKVISQWQAREACKDCGSYQTYVPVREAQPAIYNSNAVVKVLYPVKPGGLLLYRISANNIGAPQYIAGRHNWFPLGIDGVFFNASQAFFANLTPSGIKSVIVELH